MNILVDDDGKITAVVDWECVSAHALWMATATPDFLRGPNREKEPERDGYGDETASEKAKAQGQSEDEDLLDNQGKNGPLLGSFDAIRTNTASQSLYRQVEAPLAALGDGRGRVRFEVGLLGGSGTMWRWMAPGCHLEMD